MMTPEQQASAIIEHGKEIAKLWESTKSAHHRLDKNDELIQHIHRLATNIEGLTIQVKNQNERSEKNSERTEKRFESTDKRLKGQGERLGVLDEVNRQTQCNKEEIAELSKKLDDIRMEPGNKWKAVSLAALGCIITLLLTLLIGRFI